MQRTKLEIIDYFQEFIFGFIYHDVENCIKAGANYVVALALLSYTEFVGGLVSGNLGLKNKSRDNFNEGLKYFPPEYRAIDSSLKVEYVDEQGIKRTEEGIYNLFRCGMIHEYFVKGVMTTVINNPDGRIMPGSIGVEIFPGTPSSADTQKLLLFRTNEYFRDFKSVIDGIYKKLVVEYDSQLVEGFTRSTNRVYSRRIL